MVNEQYQRDLKETVKSYIGPIMDKLDILSLRLEKQEVSAASKNDAKKSWLSIAIQFLALPAAIVAILLQVSQTSQTIQTTEKTEAETLKIKTEELKARAELQVLLENIAEKKAKGITAYREEVDKTLPLLQETITRLNKLQQQSQRWRIEESLPKFIILWAIFCGISIFFDILTQLWTAAVNSLLLSLYQLKRFKVSGRARERFRKVVALAMPLLHPMPSILKWAVEISVFVALIVPFFDEVSVYLGSSVTFDSVLQSAKSLNLGEAITKVKTIISK